MNKLCTFAIVSLAALGLFAEQASAFGWLKCLCCGHSKYKVNCYPPNAFSPPCCYPCFGMAPFAYPGCGHHGCGQGCGDGGYAGGYTGPAMGAPAAPGATMPPAGAAPQYMPPAPAEADGGQARMMPTMPMYGQMMPAQNVMYQPMAMGGYYPGAGMPQMYPGMQMQQPMMMQPQMMAPQMMQQPMAPQMLAPQVMQQGYQGR